MLSLADTSIRMYRKKNGLVSLCLRSYLMVATSANFSLRAYLKEISCRLTLPSGEVIILDNVSYTDDLICKYEMGTMIYGFWASATTHMHPIRNSVGVFRMDYRICFTGHPFEKPDYFEVVVPLISRA